MFFRENYFYYETNPKEPEKDIKMKQVEGMDNRQMLN